MGRHTLKRHELLVNRVIIRIGYQGRDISIPTGPDGMGGIAKGVMDTMVGIQTGEIDHEWSVIATPSSGSTQRKV